MRLHRQLPFAASAAWDRLEAARIESFIGRVTLSVALIAVAVVIQLMLVPPERVDIIFLAAVGLVIVTARWAGFWASVVTAFMAAALIDIVLLRPGGDLIVGSIEDVGAILLFLLVALLGARAPRAPTPQAPAVEGAAVRASGSSAHLVEPLTDREMVRTRVAGQGQVERRDRRRSRGLTQHRQDTPVPPLREAGGHDPDAGDRPGARAAPQLGERITRSGDRYRQRG
jgi:Domain of unknown function (DUF4118)